MTRQRHSADPRRGGGPSPGDDRARLHRVDRRLPRRDAAVHGHRDRLGRAARKGPDHRHHRRHRRRRAGRIAAAGQRPRRRPCRDRLRARARSRPVARSGRSWCWPALIQVVAGVFKLGGWFRAISPAVVHGMLAGIGVLIVVGQFHVLFDAQAAAERPARISRRCPGRLLGLSPTSQAAEARLRCVGLLDDRRRCSAGRSSARRRCGWCPARWSASSPARWSRCCSGSTSPRVVVPASIVGCDRAARARTIWRGCSIRRSSRRRSPSPSSPAPRPCCRPRRSTGCTTASRTDYNKELRAQGVGNLLCGFAGALPMTGVIVRSSANVQAGAVTRAVDDPARRLDPRLRRAAALAAARDPDGGARRRSWSSPAGGWSASTMSAICSRITACCRR